MKSVSMKKLILLFAFMGILSGFSQKQQPKAVNTIPPVKLISAADTIQYTLGAFVAQWINSNGFVINNPTLFLKGMDDMFQNKPRLVPDSLITPFVTAYQQTIRKEKAIQLEQQLFSSLKGKPGVGMLPNGVRYVILKTGKGVHPGEKDTLMINLVAKLADGTVVEDTYQTKKPIVTTLAGLFTGLSDPLQLMAEGSKWQLFIPSVLAYGEKGNGVIPPNSALIIEVELLEVRPPKK